MIAMFLMFWSTAGDSRSEGRPKILLASKSFL